jgi:hypothetical protein
MLAVWLIRIIHYLVVAFFVIVPFTNDQRLLSIHFIGVPFLMLHWVTNQSTCALTEMEKYLTGKTDDDDTFIGKIVGPVYKFQSPQDADTFVWVVLVLLWLFTLYKLKRDNFSHLREMVSHFGEMFTRLQGTLRR